jgi:hypothetical protein
MSGEMSKKANRILGVVAHICNTNYMGDRDGRTEAITCRSMRVYLKIKLKAKRAGMWLSYKVQSSNSIPLKEERKKKSTL